ncbi:MAG: PaaI family thioesterase [Myxococcota bacterium]|nr:PaaI family thioesterase [Myxococcota bacterium]
MRHINQADGRFRASTHPGIAGRERELRSLADGVRRLNAAVVTNAADAQETARLAAAVHALADTFEPSLPDVLPARYAGGEHPDDLEPHDVFPYDPVLGIYSPLALPVEVEYAEGRAIGRARFTTAYEGPPGCVHGAVIAGVFDQVFNVANIMGGTAGPTVVLTLRYRRPTPLREDLRFEAWVEDVTDDRVTSRGRALFGDAVTVEAEGVFKMLDRDRVMRMAEPR